VSSQTLPGTFRRSLGLGPDHVVLTDLGPNFADWTTGAVRVSPMPIWPSLMQRWRVLGFSTRGRLYGVRVNPPTFGRLGKLLVGLLVDAPLTDAGSGLPGVAQFPVDLSTFDTVWDGQQDQLRFIAPPFVPAALIPDESCGLIGKTFMFPSPVEVGSGAQMQMAAVLTPSLTAGALNLVLKSLDYSLIYEEL
jgi:hypothetical protein